MRMVRVRDKVYRNRSGLRFNASFVDCTSVFVKSVIRTANIISITVMLHSGGGARETPVRSSYTLKPEKSVVIIYTSQNVITKPLHRTVGNPMKPPLWWSCYLSASKLMTNL